MKDLRTLLSSEALRKLRSSYDAGVMSEAMASTVARPYSPLSPWNDGIAHTFYAASSPLASVDRERCLIALLTCTGPDLSLAVHVYWGLMEGLSIDEVCHTIGLAASYAGVPRLAYAFPVVSRLFELLERTTQGSKADAREILRAVLEEFAEHA